jgi:sodium transport system permease protein
MKAKVVGLVYAKEIRETLRDRRTLVVMVLLPLALYPLLGVGLTQWVLSREQTRGAEPSRVGLAGVPWEELEVRLRRGPGLELVPGGSPADVRRGALDAVVRVAGPEQLQLYVDGARDRSLLAEERLHKVLMEFSDELRRETLRSFGLPASLLQPLRTERHNLATQREVTTQVLAGVLPLIVVLMVLLGAFYPAIDLTAGEKERGTLETLFVTPASRLDLMTGKFLAVATIAAATGMLNLFSIGLTAALGFGAALRAAGLGAVPWSAAALTLVALVPCALFFAALMLAVASLARSFKEAQNLLTPIYIGCVLPAMASQMPGLELTPLTALVPVANIALLTRDIIGGRVALPALATALVATFLYAGLALRIAARIYSSERMLFAPDQVRPKRSGQRPAPEPAEAVLTLLAVMALILLVGQPLQARSLIGGILTTEWLLIAAPVLVVLRFGRIDMAATLRLRNPGALRLLGAALAGLSAWYLVGVLIERLQERVLPIPPEMLRELQRMLFGTSRPLIVDLVALALSPAICEELLFRGLLLRVSWPALRAPAAVLLNGVLFGVFHLSVYRFASTFVLGTVLALIVVRSGSIYASMLFHFLNNGAALVVGRMLARSGAAETEPTLTPGFLILAAVVLATGLWLVLRPRRGPSAPPDRSG